MIDYSKRRWTTTKLERLIDEFNDVVGPLTNFLLPGGSAYTYLPASVARFPAAEKLADLLRGAGFADVRFRLLGGSIIALHTGRAGVGSTDGLVHEPGRERG